MLILIFATYFPFVKRQNFSENLKLCHFPELGDVMNGFKSCYIFCRFTSFPGDFEGDDEKCKEDEDDEEDDDPWENKTREITFGSAARPEGSELESTSNLSPIKMSPGKAAAIVDASSPSSFDHVTCRFALKMFLLMLVPHLL